MKTDLFLVYKITAAAAIEPTLWNVHSPRALYQSSFRRSLAQLNVQSIGVLVSQSTMNLFAAAATVMGRR